MLPVLEMQFLAVSKDHTARGVESSDPWLTLAGCS